jgi:hypothetical protein
MKGEKMDKIEWRRPKTGMGMRRVDVVYDSDGHELTCNNLFEPVIESIRKRQIKEQNEMIIKNSYVCINGIKYRVDDIDVDSSPLCIHPIAQIRTRICEETTIHEDGRPKVTVTKVQPCNKFEIKNIIVNGPATIVFWEDGTKTMVKCDNEDFDLEKAIAMAFARKALGNKYDYYNVFKKWLKKAKNFSEA